MILPEKLQDVSYCHTEKWDTYSCCSYQVMPVTYSFIIS